MKNSFVIRHSSFVIQLLLIASVAAQAPRPPIQKLSGLSGDVSITSPTNGQAFIFNSVTGKWENGTGLTDTVITSTTDAGVVANFATAQLISPSLAVTVLDWTGGLSFKTNLQDDSGIDSISLKNRRLYKTDGSTIEIDYANGVKFPQLTTDGYLKVTGGNGTLDVDPTGTLNPGHFIVGPNISTPGQLIQFGDTSGVSASESLLSTTSNRAVVQDAQNGDISFQAINNNSGASAIAGYLMSNDEGGQASSYLYSSGVSSSGILGPGDLVVTGPIAGSIRNIAIRSFNKIRFSCDGGTSSALDLTKAGLAGRVSVTSTVDQTATTETAHVVFTVPANSAAVGTTFRIAAWGNTDSGTSITITPKLRWGGTAGALLQNGKAFTTGSAQSAKDWKLEAYVTVRTTGASGSAVSTVSWESYNSSAYVSDMSTSGSSPNTIDTTANKDLDLTFTLSATTGTPHVRTFGGTIEVVKP